MIYITYFTYESIVTYPDVSMDGCLSHTGLLRILQEAAAVASHVRGISFRTVEKTGICWILMGWKFELIERPEWNAKLTIHTWPRTLDGFTSDREFEVFCNDRLVARATSRWFLLNAETKRLTRVNDFVRSAYELNDRRLFDEDIPSNGTSLDDAQVTYRKTVSRLDLDTYNHVNNLRYLDYALEALPDELFRSPPRTVQIVYRKQILEGTPIRCLYGITADGKHQIEVQSGEGSETIHHAYIWFY